jgi:co-chaperonin GroES (HSP10)
MSAERMEIVMTLEEAFPNAEPGLVPTGGRVLVQLRNAKRRSAGGLILTAESKDFEKWNTAVGKVLALGELAYKDRMTGEPWPEGAWVQVGDYVRVPKWGGDRWEVRLSEDPEDVARFVVYNDREVIGKITGDPLQFIDYV